MTHPEPPLTDEQQGAVENYLNGALLLLATVGAGKTRVLAERAAAAIAHGLAAERLLCLTFTNRAAQEMRQRLQHLLGPAAKAITVKTFHGLCTHILRQEAPQLGLPVDFIVYDEVDSLELILTLLPQPMSQSDITTLLNHHLGKLKTQATGSQLSLAGPDCAALPGLPRWQRELAARYQAGLRERHALDFNDLIYYVRALFAHLPASRERWAARFDFIQVDEVQDTHLAEYELVRVLAERHGRLACIGDPDQTIYQWRGSEPERVLAAFRHDFQPQTAHLTLNHRATRCLLQAADSFAGSIRARQTAIQPADHCPPGDKISLHHARDGQREGQWIGQQIANLERNQPEFPFHRVAILTRTHLRSRTVAGALAEAGIPTVTVEQYEFFRRQEVKDALAWLRLLLNPYDAGALRRVLQRPTRGIGPATIDQISRQGQPCGLRLTDLARLDTFDNGDPFGPLLAAYHTGALVVFDVETTGLAVEKDEVIQLAATKLVKGQIADSQQWYLRNRQPVGESVYVHQITDDFLGQHGQPAKAVLKEFFTLAKGALWVGHNVGFDIRMVLAQARRDGLRPSVPAWADTLELARRFVPASNYRLSTLVAELGLSSPATHDAGADVAATVELLHVLLPKVAATATTRQALANRLGGPFQPLAEQLEGWRQAATTLRPAALLERVLHESGLWAWYEQAGEPARLAHLSRLVETFAGRDEPELHPETALRALVEYVALAANVDFVALNENRVVIATVHQAKGLEFDHVFLAGAAENEFPTYHSCQNGGNLEEEKRLFYVALTRARQRLFISSCRFDGRGYEHSPSRFIQAIDRSCLRR